MEFVFRGEASLGSECRRVLLAEAEAAIGGLADFPAHPDRVIHETRKHNKRMRSILLLARPVLESGDIVRANRLIRNAARRFSEARDALVRQDTADKLLENYGAKRVGIAFPAFREELAANHLHLLEHGGLPGQASLAASDFSEAAGLVARWNWDQVGHEIAVSAMVSNYRLGLVHFESARASRDPDECHEWRKKAKYLFFHLSLFAHLDPPEFARHAALAEELASWLGQHHDLAVFEETLQNATSIPEKSARVLIRLSEERRAELERASFELGRDVYKDRPERFRKRLSGLIATTA